MSVSGIQLPGGMDGHPRCRTWIKFVHVFLRSSSKQKRNPSFQFSEILNIKGISISIFTRKISTLLENTFQD